MFSLLIIDDLISYFALFISNITMISYYMITTFDKYNILFIKKLTYNHTYAFSFH